MIDDREVRYFSSHSTRLLLASATIGLMLASATSAFTHIWRQTRPELVLAFFPEDPIASVNFAESHWPTTLSDPERRREMTFVAKLALRGEPLTPAALRLLGLVEASQQEMDKARASMLLAHRLTRRETATSFWLIHDSAARGDMKGTLRYYDEALLTNADAADVLFPLLAKALFDPAVRRALSLYVQNRPSWMPRFLRFAAAETAPDEVAKLVIEAGKLPSTKAYEGLDPLILGKLMDRSSLAMAQFYLRHVMGVVSHITSDLSFTPKTMDPTLGPFAWQFTDQLDIGAMLDDQGRLTIRAASDREGVVARRLLAADAGTYNLRHSVTFASGVPAAQLRWELRCVSAASGASAWKQDIPIRATSGTHIFAFTIPDHCPAQEFSLRAENNQVQGEALATIGAIELRRGYSGYFGTTGS